MKWRGMGQRRPVPSGRRATLIGAILSLLLPGLGQAYLGLLGRALIWLAGTIGIAVVISGGEDNMILAASMGVAIGLCSAIDVLIVTRRG